MSVYRLSIHPKVTYAATLAHTSLSLGLQPFHIGLQVNNKAYKYTEK